MSSLLCFLCLFAAVLLLSEITIIAKNIFLPGHRRKESTMASPASFKGHPIHPMIIPFPIALWVFSLVADVIYLWRGNPVWKDFIAFYALLAGIIGAIAAAVPGLIDWLSITDKAVVRIANWHARLNVIALVIFGISFYLRTTSGANLVSDSYIIPVLLSALGFVLITISGWLGGEMVFKHGVAVSSGAESTPKSAGTDTRARAA
jgi:uncharacterized membrane protein